MRGILLLALLCTSLAMIEREFAEQAEMTFDKTQELINGIIDGLNMKGDVENFKECLMQVPIVVAKIKEAIESFKSIDWKDINKIFELFSKLFDSLKELFVTLKSCFKIKTDIEGLIKKLSNINFEKLLAKLWDIFTTITDVLKRFEKKEHNAVGKGLGNIVFLILLEDNCSAMLGNGFQDFVRRLLEGIGVGKDIEDLLKCVQGEGQEIWKKIREAVELLKHISITHINNLFKGLKKLFEGILEILNMVLKCGSKAEIIIKIIKAIKNCNVMSLVCHLIKHLIKHAPAFIADIIACISGFTRGDLKAAGRAIGDMIRKLFLGALLENDENMVMDFFKGFLEGIGETEDIKEIERCLKSIEFIWGDIIKAFELILTLKFEKIMESCKLLFEVFK